MSLAALIAFLEANGTILLALLVVFEQWLAQSKHKSNSTLQLIANVGRAVLGKFAKKKS
jgi:hypothetical protein